MSIYFPLVLFYDISFIKSFGDQKVDSIEKLIDENQDYLPEYNLDPGYDMPSADKLPRESRKRSSRSGSIGSKLELLHLLKPDELDLSVVQLVTKQPKMTRVNGLGNLYFMTYEDMDIKLRKIKLRDISSFVIGQMNTQIKQFIKNCPLDCIEKYITVIGDEKGYYLVMQANPGYFTLAEIFQRSDSMTLSDKLALMLQVCRAMNRIALQGSVCHHGHLHPHNILVRLSIIV